VTWNRVRRGLCARRREIARVTLSSRCIGPLRGRLDQPAGPARQQAPGFCAQKSSNCCASEPAAGVAVLVGLLALVSGDVVPPLAESPLVLPVLPVAPVESLDESDELLSELLLSLLELEPELELSSFPEAAAAGAWLDSGTATSAGAPGTSGAPASEPPQPAAASASRPTTSIAARRGAPIVLTPP
jgi:hypothetical protein